MNQHAWHTALAGRDTASSDALVDSSEPSAPVVVGDVVVRQDESGFGIFNYRGERVLDLPMRTVREAERLAAEIVSPWHGRVRVDTGAR